MKITLIGLGVEEGDLSANALKAIGGASKIFARTALAPSFKSVEGFAVQPLDDVFATCRNFDTLNKKLASIVLKAAKESDVAYLVDGAVSEDNACKIILARHKDTAVYEGVSKAARAVSLARIKSTQFTGVSAYDIKNLKSCPAAAVYDIDCDYVAGEVKIKLTDLFGEETECVFIRGGKVKRIKVYEIDRQKDYDMLCAVAIEEADFLHKERYDYADLLQLVRLLRAPGGCPWDRVQTNATIKQNMIEEAYELVDAVNKNDDDMIEEETGDVLLQAAFHTVLKEEQSAFTSADVITRVVKKLIFRHSHIFGKDKAADEEAALSVWEKNKKEEKHQTTFTESLLAVPTNFPACMRAQKVGKRAAKCGMDFLSSISASEKLGEEVGELLQALQNGDKDGIFEEAGDVLLSAVNTCRLAGVDCEEALAAATDKFIDRFKAFEELATKDGKELTDMCDAEYDYYWFLAKNAVKKD